MNYIVVYDEDRVKGFSEYKEVENFIYYYINEQVKRYCYEYDIDIEELSPQRKMEIVFAEGEEIKIYKVSELLKIIANTDIDDDDKINLEKNLKSYKIDGYISEYEGFEEVLEKATCINIDL